MLDVTRPMKGSLSYNLFVVSGPRFLFFGEGGPTRPQADPARQPYQGIIYGRMCQGNNLSYPQLYFLFLFDNVARIWEIVVLLTIVGADW